ncbi:class I SAM-dependent methyltransferase [Bacillus spongiae]|uniref:Class I SAM-dependent methyltransferase n=1 Tax=Bacillus spongiae TaxID=2683610 RepID=A0ABU8HDW8_9BACI
MNKTESLKINKEGWDKVAEEFFSACALPVYGPFAPSETELNLFDEVKSKKILEIGCGSGHSLQYLNEKGASELWGLDLSSSQIDTANKLLKQNQVKANLFVSPMETNPGIPENYFDIVCSIFALGWTTDLSATLRNIFSYLKPKGTFIFSWEHPLYSKIKYDGDHYIINDSYNSEGENKKESWRGVPIVMNQRKMSTFINELISTGFILEVIVEEFSGEVHNDCSPYDWYSSKRASLIPATMIVKCYKPF